MKRALLIVALVACNAPDSSLPRIDSVTPDYGPLVGGTRVVIAGENLGVNPVRVFVAGTEAPLANSIDGESVEIVIPPGLAPGDAELVLVHAEGNAIANGKFRYSTQPSITSISPAEVVFYAETIEPPTMTVTGTGFFDEGAGTPVLLVDGVPAMDVVVASDTELTFTAPGGRALGRPRIEIVNARGLAVKERGFRYRPSTRGGILLFPRSSPLFAVFYDPVDNTRIDIPRTGSSLFVSTVILDEHGEYWATESNRIGRVDLSTQRIEQTAPIQFRLPAMTRVGANIYAIDRWTLRFGTIRLDGTFTPISTNQLPCCGSYGIASNGTKLYFTSRSGGSADKFITSINPATGEMGTPVKLVGAPNLHIEEMRYFQGAFYATSRDSTLVKIDPSTGVVTHLMSVPRANAMEVFE